MTLRKLRQYVKPCTVEIDSTGCVEVLTPDGYCFEHTMHVLVNDPAMLDYPTQEKLYQIVAADFDSFTLQPCASNCSCKEEVKK